MLSVFPYQREIKWTRIRTVKIENIIQRLEWENIQQRVCSNTNNTFKETKNTKQNKKQKQMSNLDSTNSWKYRPGAPVGWVSTKTEATVVTTVNAVNILFVGMVRFSIILCQSKVVFRLCWKHSFLHTNIEWCSTIT